MTTTSCQDGTYTTTHTYFQHHTPTYHHTTTTTITTIPTTTLRSIRLVYFFRDEMQREFEMPKFANVCPSYTHILRTHEETGTLRNFDVHWYAQAHPSAHVFER